MSGIGELAQSAMPRGLVGGLGLQMGASAFGDVRGMSAAIGNTAAAQHVGRAEHASSVARYLPSAIGAQMAQLGQTFKDASQNTSELPVGTTLMVKRYPAPDAFEQTFLEGTSLFVSTVDTEHGSTAASVPVLNILQQRRSQIVASQSRSAAAAAVARAGMSAAARRFDAQLHAGTTGVLQLAASDANDFAGKWNLLGEVLKREPGAAVGVDPVFSVTTPNIAETRVANLFGRPSANDRCYYLVKGFERVGEFATAGRALGFAADDELLQVRGFSSSQMPHTLSGPDRSAEDNDLFYVQKEREIAADYIEYEWDDEADAPRVRNLAAQEGFQEVLANVGSVVYDAFLSGKVYSVGHYKGRFPTRSSAEEQLRATMSTACYGALERVTLWNLRGTLRS